MSTLDPITVRRYGDQGAHVVLLHGGPGSPGSMAPLSHMLENRFRISEPLQRRSGVMPLTVERHVEDLHDVWPTISSNIGVRLVGHSWGAMLALTYAARHPAGIDRIILIGCGTFDEPSRKAYEAEMQRRIEAHPAIRSKIAAIENQLEAEIDQHQRNDLFGELGMLATTLQAFDASDDIPAYEGIDERGHAESWADALALQAYGLQPMEFERIKVPVIMIHGAADPHPGLMIRKSLAAHIPTLSFHEIKRCGHTPWLERDTVHEFETLLAEHLVA